MIALLRFFEGLWILAIACSFGVGIYNFFRHGTFDHNVYFPLICGVLSIIVLFNIRSQRRFTMKHRKVKQDANDQ